MPCSLSILARLNVVLQENSWEKSVLTRFLARLLRSFEICAEQIPVWSWESVLSPHFLSKPNFCTSCSLLAFLFCAHLSWMRDFVKQTEVFCFAVFLNPSHTSDQRKGWVFFLSQSYWIKTSNLLHMSWVRNGNIFWKYSCDSVLGIGSK